MIVWLVLALLILGWRAKRKSPKEIQQALTTLAIYNDPRLVMKMQEHDAKMQLYQAKIAQANNSVVKGDQEIEKLQLEIMKLRKELGIDAGDFKPLNYP